MKSTLFDQHFSCMHGAEQLLSMQGTSILQPSDSTAPCSSPHADPPQAGETVISNTLEWLPPPQRSEQGANAPHEPTQSTAAGGGGL